MFLVKIKTLKMNGKLVLCREVGKKIETLELKNAVLVMRKFLDGLSSRMRMIKERVN